MAAFAIMLRRLLAAGGAAEGVRSMLATAYAANALSVSVPLAGPELATAFTFRRFTRQGADAPLAGWSPLAGGIVSSAAAALIPVGGGLASLPGWQELERIPQVSRSRGPPADRDPSPVEHLLPCRRVQGSAGDPPARQNSAPRTWKDPMVLKRVFHAALH